MMKQCTTLQLPSKRASLLFCTPIPLSTPMLFKFVFSNLVAPRWRCPVGTSRVKQHIPGQTYPQYVESCSLFSRKHAHAGHCLDFPNQGTSNIQRNLFKQNFNASLFRS